MIVYLSMDRKGLPHALIELRQDCLLGEVDCGIVTFLQML